MNSPNSRATELAGLLLADVNQLCARDGYTGEEAASALAAVLGMVLTRAPQARTKRVREELLASASRRVRLAMNEALDLTAPKLEIVR
jgi:hypothetical protein